MTEKTTKTRNTFTSLPTEFYKVFSFHTKTRSELDDCIIDIFNTCKETVEDIFKTTDVTSKLTFTKHSDRLDAKQVYLTFHYKNSISVKCCIGNVNDSGITAAIFVMDKDINRSSRFAGATKGVLYSRRKNELEFKDKEEFTKHFPDFFNKEISVTEELF